jgi:hypothetical protein
LLPAWPDADPISIDLAASGNGPLELAREIFPHIDIHLNAELRTFELNSTLGEPDAARVAAAVALLDRGYGKPPQAVTAGGEPIKVIADVRWKEEPSAAG